MSKLNVAVLFGGKSAERDVSLSSGTEVARNLDRKKYSVFPIEIDKNGVTWKYNKTKSTDYSKLLKNLKIDVVFIVLHGPFGEDGTVQGLLEMIGVPFTGSGVRGSALGMDKQLSRHLFIHNKLTVPKFIMHLKGDPIKFDPKLGYLFVQPDNQGSSIGASIAKDQKGLESALKVAYKYSNSVFVDNYIKGTEITCAVMGNKKPVALPVVEIVPKHEFFDYESKYNPKLVDEICPARISVKMTKKAQEAAVQAYKAIGCRAFGRIDMIIKDEDVYVLEINTIPGLTPVSLFPKAAKEEGLSYTELLDKIIEFSLDD